MKKPRKITPEIAGKLMGKGAVFVREAMKAGDLPIGVALQMPESQKWSFFISPSRLAEYLGIEVKELLALVEEMHNEAS